VLGRGLKGRRACEGPQNIIPALSWHTTPPQAGQLGLILWVRGGGWGSPHGGWGWVAHLATLHTGTAPRVEAAPIAAPQHSQQWEQGACLAALHGTPPPLHAS